MLEKYRTVSMEASATVIEKKSKFIATVKPLCNQDDATDFISKIKKKYWDASHNVFAYQIGDNDEIQRMSDDGEPSGTAGVPILEILKKENIKNTIVVVTRYFGGILLGTGGLVRAYSQAAKEGLREAILVDKLLYAAYEVISPYSVSGKIEYFALNNEHIINNAYYTDNVKFEILVRYSNIGFFEKQIQEISSATANVVNKEFLYLDFKKLS